MSILNCQQIEKKNNLIILNSIHYFLQQLKIKTNFLFKMPHSYNHKRSLTH